MNIALDYDRTYTAAPGLFAGFITAAAALGHDVYIVTLRYEHEPIENDYDKVIYCAREAKARVCNRLGIKIDVWIDDNPMHILEGA